MTRKVITIGLAVAGVLLSSAAWADDDDWDDESDGY